jgi:SAM-dependent methyltransferase
MSHTPATPTPHHTPASDQLHLGCGRTIKEGWVNLDHHALPGVDVVADLNACRTQSLPFPDNHFRVIHGVHVLEHVADPLPLMQELHRIAQPGAKAVFHMPYGSSDDAWTDPTHVRPYLLESFVAFGQPYYWRADYGYHGDWLLDLVELSVYPHFLVGKTEDEVRYAIHHLRNVVAEMRVEMQAIKPIRPQSRDLAPRVSLRILPFGT